MKNSLGIYIHIPFCIRKCNYCDFLSYPMSSEAQKHYVDALLFEMKQKGALLEGRRACSVFIGGGTPSVLEASHITRIMQELRRYTELEEGAEVTIEANPGTLDAQKLENYLEAGINRLSMGVQSSHRDELEILGRIHGFDEFTVNYEAARRAGFKNISADLMFGIPGQTVRSYRETLEAAASLSLEHISAYSLIVEEGTPFYEMYGADGGDEAKNLVGLPDEDTERDMYELTVRFLNERGYRQYEISNYAKSGFESRHNTLYWQRGEYLGLGVGASSLLSETRYKNCCDYKQYMDSVRCSTPLYAEKEEMTVQDQMSEYMFLGMRLLCGVDKRKFRECFGADISHIYGSVIEKYKGLGLLGESRDRVYLTPEGVSISNVIFADFII